MAPPLAPFFNGKVLYSKGTCYKFRAQDGKVFCTEQVIL